MEIGSKVKYLGGLEGYRHISRLLDRHNVKPGDILTISNIRVGGERVWLKFEGMNEFSLDSNYFEET